MAELAPFLDRKYKLVSSENFENFLETMGIGWVGRKFITSVSPVVHLSKNENGEYCFTSSSSIKTTETKFKLGEEFEEMTAYRKKVQSIVTQEGGKLTYAQKGESDLKIVREFSPSELKMVMSFNGVVSTRIYKAL